MYGLCVISIYGWLRRPATTLSKVIQFVRWLVLCVSERSPAVSNDVVPAPDREWYNGIVVLLLLLLPLQLLDNLCFLQHLFLLYLRYLYLKLITLLTIPGISHPCLTSLELGIATFSFYMEFYRGRTLYICTHTKCNDNNRKTISISDAQTHQIPIANNLNRKCWISYLTLFSYLLPTVARPFIQFFIVRANVCISFFSFLFFSDSCIVSPLYLFVRTKMPVSTFTRRTTNCYYTPQSMFCLLLE